MFFHFSSSLVFPVALWVPDEEASVSQLLVGLLGGLGFSLLEVPDAPSSLELTLFGLVDDRAVDGLANLRLHC